MRLKIYKIICYILISLLIITFGLIVIKYYSNIKNDEENKKVVSVFYQNDNNDTVSSEQVENEKKVFFNGYEVIGTIRIPKINIEYPILSIETSNPEETKIPMKKSIVRYWGNNVNDFGNLSLAGHNNHDGTMFGKTKKLEVNDLIELTDLYKNTIVYQIYEKFVTNPNDVSILLTKDENIREVTLITCTNGNKNRLILKAKELI